MDERRRLTEHAEPERRSAGYRAGTGGQQPADVLFALPSGVMADIVDRRKYLLFSQLWVFIAAAGLAVPPSPATSRLRFCW